MAILDPNEIFEFVSGMVNEGVDAIDAVLTYCHQSGIEPEVVGDIVAANPNLLSLVEEAAEGFNLIAKTSRLQFE